MDLISFDLLATAGAVELQTALSKDVRLAAKKLAGHAAWFVCAEDVTLQDKKKATVFVVLKTEAEAKSWLQRLKTLRPKAFGAGTCRLQPNGNGVRVALGKMTGDRAGVLKAVDLAFRQDTAVTVLDGAAAAPDGTRPAGTGTAGATATSAGTAGTASTAGTAAPPRAAPTITQLVDRVPVSAPEKAEIIAALKEYAGLGLSERQLKDALRATFG